MNFMHHGPIKFEKWFGHFVAECNRYLTNILKMKKMTRNCIFLYYKMGDTYFFFYQKLEKHLKAPVVLLKLNHIYFFNYEQ